MDKYIYEENKPIGLQGQRHKRYLQEHKKSFCTTLLIGDKPNPYLPDIDIQAQEHMERPTEQLKQSQGITIFA